MRILLAERHFTHDFRPKTAHQRIKEKRPGCGVILIFIFHDFYQLNADGVALTLVRARILSSISNFLE